MGLLNGYRLKPGQVSSVMGFDKLSPNALKLFALSLSKGIV